MPDRNIEINKLNIIKTNLFKQLKNDFDKEYEGVMSLDYLKLIHEYVNHQCGVETPYSSRANEIVSLDLNIDFKLGVVHLPKSRIALQHINYLIDSGKIIEDIQIQKASEFLAITQKILEVDDVTAQRDKKLEIIKVKNHEKMAFITEVLDPWILEHSFEQYKNKQYRDAVLNAFISLGDLLREKTGVALDGAALAAKALSIKDPQIILSELDSESGRNDQIGFMQIIQGSFTGIRNPKAHSIRHDLDEHKTVQYLVLASLLARRIKEAHIVVKEQT